MKLKDIIPWVAVAITLLMAGAGLYRSFIQSQMITAANQDRVKEISVILSGIMDRQLEFEKWKIELENRIRTMEVEHGEQNGPE